MKEPVKRKFGYRATHNELFVPRANTPDSLSEYRLSEARNWKSENFAILKNCLERFWKHHTKLGMFPSADIGNFVDYDILRPNLLVLDVSPQPLDFKYIFVGDEVTKSNQRPLIGESINGLRARNYSNYGLYGHQAEMYCLFMDAHFNDDVFATSRNMTVCVDDTTRDHKTKDIDIAAVRASSNGIYPDKIIAITAIKDVVTS